jgi:transcriptional regulator with XRE-family HTH domain
MLCLGALQYPSVKIFGYAGGRLTWVNPASQNVVPQPRILPSAISPVSSVPVGKTPGRLGVWLHEELTKRGYDLKFRGQSQFAREAGVAASIVNRILNEDRGAENSILKKIGQALGYSFGEMLLFSGQAERDDLFVRPPDELQATSDNPYTDGTERQIWMLPGLEDGDKKMFIRLVRTIRSEGGAEDEKQGAKVHQLRKPS